MRLTRVSLMLCSAAAMAGPAFAQSGGDGQLIKCESPIGTYNLINTEQSEVGEKAEQVLRYVLSETHCFSGFSEEGETTITLREVEVQPQERLVDERIGGRGLLGSIARGVSKGIQNQNPYYAIDIGARSRSISPMYRRTRTLNTSVDYSRYADVAQISNSLGLQGKPGYFLVAATIEAVNAQVGPIVEGARNKRLIEENFERKQAARREQQRETTPSLSFTVNPRLAQRYANDSAADQVFQCFRVVAQRDLEEVKSILLTDANIDDYLAENTRTGRVSQRSIFYGDVEVVFTDGRRQSYRASCRPIVGGLALGDLRTR